MKGAGTIGLKIVLTIATSIVSLVCGAAVKIALGEDGASMDKVAVTVSLASLIIPIWRTSRMEWRVMSALFAMVAGMAIGAFSLFGTEYLFHVGAIELSTAITIYGIGATAAPLMSLMVVFSILQKGR